MSIICIDINLHHVHEKKFDSALIINLKFEPTENILACPTYVPVNIHLYLSL